MEKQIRTLRADEIECRVQQVTEKGCILLIYKELEKIIKGKYEN